jgi:hypothetical protein
MPVRQAEVQSQFLKDFGTLYPQFTFRTLRRFQERGRELFGMALRVALGRAGAELDLLCVPLSDGHPQEVQRLIRRIQAELPEPAGGVPAVAALVAPYLGPEGQALCRQHGMAYFDLAGNAGLETERYYLEISGKSNRHVRKKAVRRPFEGKAERIARLLLLHPERRWTMRELAREADISLGLASMATSALAEEGLVAKSRAGLELFDPAGLLDAWAEHYDLRRSPYRTFRARSSVAQMEERLARQAQHLGEQYALTLWSGADQSLGEQASDYVALYWAGPPDELVNLLGLHADLGRTYVFVFQPYDASLLWGAGITAKGLRVAHPLQLYLDLGSGDERELELAKRLRERLLPW